MLCKRVVPTLLVRGRTLVKGKGFAGDRSVGHVLQAAKVHARRGVDELVILDIAATSEGRGPDLEMVRALSADCFVPITVGGGVKSLDDIDALLRAGADKVCLGTAALRVSGLIAGAADRFGRQAIVVSVDYRYVLAPGRDSKAPAIALNCGTVGPMITGSDEPFIRPMWLVDWAETEGAGEILLQCIDRDGTMEGYDLEMITEVAAATSIPVIASGGAGSYADMLAAIHAGADAVAAGAMFAFSDATPRGAAKYLKDHGICVRL